MANANGKAPGEDSTSPRPRRSLARCCSLWPIAGCAGHGAPLNRNNAQLREDAKPSGVASGVGLEPLLQRIADAARQRGRRLEVEIVDRIATGGDASRLERVIGHNVQNALDAALAHCRVWVTLRQMSGRVALLVGDTGAGMDPEFIRNRLFRPFNSTKASGMGIGSYESVQYIRELGGNIDVASEVGRGTQVTITLPLFDVRTASNLRTVEAN